MAEIVTLQEFLERDRGRFIAELEKGMTPEKAVAVLESESDRLLLQYNEQAIGDRARDAASHMMHAVRAVLPIADCVGDTKIWETAADSAQDLPASHKKKVSPLVLLAAGIALLLAACLLCIKTDPVLPESIRPFAGFILTACGGALLFFGGRRLSAPPLSEKKMLRRTENRVDAGKIYRAFRAAVSVADRNIEAVRAEERYEKYSAPEAGSVLSPAEAELYSGLLEAAYSGDGDFALGRIESLKYYLHTREVEIVDYTDETAELFDVMPSKLSGTLRPALVQGGKVLRRGMAAG